LTNIFIILVFFLEIYAIILMKSQERLVKMILLYRKTMVDGNSLTDYFESPF